MKKELDIIRGEMGMSSVVTPKEHGNAIKVWAVNEELSRLLGQVLTIVDASIEGEKNNAIKALIRERFGDKQNFFWELQSKQEEGDGCGHAPGLFWESYLVPFIQEKQPSFRA